MQRNDRLRRHRVTRNLRQQDVADHLGTTILTVQRWERGSQQPSAYYRIKLCALFGVGAQDLGLIEANPSLVPHGSEAQETEQKDESSSERSILWMIPYARNPHFTGRDELLDQIMWQFAPSKDGPRTTLNQAALTQAQTIKGLGGIGKTQIAVEYAYRARDQGRYAHTLWINAASEEAVLTSFVVLAHLLPAPDLYVETDQRKLVAGVLHWLEQCQQPWLLIMDNADDLVMVQPYLPRQGNGCLLFTTRASAVGIIGSSIEVEMMDLMEGTQLLLHRALRLTDASDEEINEASNIVSTLGYFPLAIDQAAAYIEETECNLQDYLSIYEHHHQDLLARRGAQTMGYPDSVATTWSLSFQRVEQANPAAAELLRLCAFVAPDSIPEELLTEGAAYWPPVLQKAVADLFSFNQMLKTLLAFSLVKRLSEDRLLSVHRLVQTVQMDRLQPQEQRQWAERLVKAVNAIFPYNPQEDTNSWPLCLRYLEQVQSCDILIQQHHLLLPEAAEVLDRTGTYLRERVLYSLAEPLYRQALYIWEQQVQPESVGKARSLNNLARISFWQDKPTQAESLHFQALHIREQQLGPEHPDVAESLHDLAGLYRIQGKYTEAEEFYLQALHIREQQLGAGHLLVAESVNGLAVLYEKQGRYAQAEVFTLQALHIREQQLGAEHLLVAESVNDLAVLYSSIQEKRTEIEPLFLRAIRIWEQQLGPENPMMAYSLSGLARFYREQGKYAEAESLYLRVLRIREQHLGETHRNLISPLTGLAYLYREQGKYALAEMLYQRALYLCEQQLRIDHPLTAITLDGLAKLYSLQDKFADSERLYLHSLHIREQHLGPEHADVSRSLDGLATLYTRQKKYTEADPLYQRALRICEQQLGAEHFEMADVLAHFADFQQAQGHIAEAARLYQRVLTIREEALGPDFFLTNETRKYLDNVLALLRSTEKASALGVERREGS